MNFKQSEKYQEALARLPDDLRPIFDNLLEEYFFFTQLEYGRGYVAYAVFADLVLAGWRRSGPTSPDSPLFNRKPVG